MKLLIKNGRVIDPANELDGSFDLILDKGKIHSVKPTGIIPDNYRENAKVIDASECVVAPGFIETEMTESIPVEQVLSLIPARRVGRSEEVAVLVDFLISPRSSYITRQVISVNGGMF